MDGYVIPRTAYHLPPTEQVSFYIEQPHYIHSFLSSCLQIELCLQSFHTHRFFFVVSLRNRTIALTTNSANQNHGKKRRRIGSPPDPHLRQRTKRVRSSGFDVRSLSATQLATLSEAASILQVPPSALLDLAPTAQHKRHRTSTRPHRVSSEMGGNRSYGGDSPPTAHYQSKSSFYGDSNSNISSANPAYENCDMPSFGIGLVPKQVAECFAGFSPSRSERVSVIEYTG